MYCALTAAERILEGYRLSYALIERSDVLTISIHGQPRITYPYFSGFKGENGIGAGENYNMNMPLPESVSGSQYYRALEIALKRVKRFRPDFLIVALGLDTARGDPTGTWSLEAEDFEANGRMLGSLNLPTIVIQEGGYDSRVLGINVRHFFEGLWSGASTRY